MMKPIDQIPTSAEHALLRAFLAAKGCRPQDIDDAAGPHPAGRDRRQIAAGIIQWLKSRPKA